jgi:predicted Na+-dependent transporter
MAFMFVITLLLTTLVHGSDIGQPTSLPTSLYIAPSIPQEIVSDLLAPTLTPILITLNPTRISIDENHEIRKEGDSFAVPFSVFLAIVAALVIGLVCYYFYKRYVCSMRHFDG